MDPLTQRFFYTVNVRDMHLVEILDADKDGEHSQKAHYKLYLDFQLPGGCSAPNS